jgi:hypothetical protein
LARPDFNISLLSLRLKVHSSDRKDADNSEASLVVSE